MLNYLIIACLCITKYVCMAQTTSAGCDSLGKNSSGGIALNRFGVSTIKLKDGTMLKNCAIKEIKPLWVVYVKNRTIHDIMIDKINYIVTEDNLLLWFDESGKPMTGPRKEKHW